MPPAFAQGNSVNNNSTAALLIPFLSDNTLGGLIVVLARIVTSSGPFNCSDSAGNTYIPITQSVYSGTGQRLCGWYTLNCRAGANTVTVSAGGTNQMVGAIGEWTGVPAAAVVEGPSGFGTAASGNVATTPNFTTVGASDLLVALSSELSNTAQAAPSVNNGFTVRVSGPSTINSLSMADKIASAGIQSASFTYSQSTFWGAFLIAFIVPVESSKTHSIDSITQIDTSKIFSIDACARQDKSNTYSIDAFSFTNISKSYSIDAIGSRPGIIVIENHIFEKTQVRTLVVTVKG